MRYFEIETTVDGTFELLVNGYVERKVVRVDFDGEPIEADHVVVTEIYPAVIADDGTEMYGERPLSSYPIAWKEDLLQTFLDKASEDE